MLETHLKKKKSTKVYKVHQTMSSLDTKFSQHQALCRAYKKDSKMLVECTHAWMNDMKEFVLLKTTMTERKSDPLELPSCHSKTWSKTHLQGQWEQKSQIWEQDLSWSHNDTRSFSGDHVHLARKDGRKIPQNRSCMKTVNIFRGAGNSTKNVK